MTTTNKLDIFNRLVNNSRAIIKSQQRDEIELSLNEKLKILDDLFECNLSKFLEKYSNYLNYNDLNLLREQALKSSSSKNTIDYYLKKIEKHDINVKNRRYEALQRLIKNGEYFNDESMKAREPLLYEEMIEKFNGQVLDKATYMRNGNYLTDFFMQHLDNLNHMERVNKMRNVEGDVEEEVDTDDDESELDDDDDDDDIEESEEDKAERLNMRNEFVMIMHRKFLNGEDKNFDYAEVDFNDDYDNIEIESRDKEEKYFDDDNDDIDETHSNSARFNNDYDY